LTPLIVSSGNGATADKHAFTEFKLNFLIAGWLIVALNRVGTPGTSEIIAQLNSTPFFVAVKKTSYSALELGATKVAMTMK